MYAIIILVTTLAVLIICYYVSSTVLTSLVILCGYAIMVPVVSCVVIAAATLAECSHHVLVTRALSAHFLHPARPRKFGAQPGIQNSKPFNDKPQEP